jgi:hypothetical protein
MRSQALIHVSEDFANAVRDKYWLEPRGTMKLMGTARRDVLSGGGRPLRVTHLDAKML